MKTCNILASALFGSLAAAAPLRQRDLFTKTEVVVETVVVYTTIWDGEAPVAQATSTVVGQFYEKPSQPASSKVVPTPSAPAYTPPVVKSSKVESSSVYTPAPAPSSVNTPAPEPSSVYTPAPEPSSVYTPAPEPSSVYTPAPAPATSAAAAPTPSSQPSSGAPSDSHHGDITIYDNTGAAGACGKSLTDDMMIVALAKGTWGESTYDVMTGESTNPWCGKTITIEYNGNTIEAEIQDLCPGCEGVADIDLSYSAWKALTGTDEKTRFEANWWVSS